MAEKIHEMQFKEPPAEKVVDTSKQDLQVVIETIKDMQKKYA